MFGLLRAAIEILNSALNLFVNRSEKQDESRRTKEQHAWQWLDYHLPALENAAQDAYSFILKKSSAQVLLDYAGSTYPFVEKLSTFPSDDRNAIKVNFLKLRGKKSKRGWAKCNSYVKLWRKCVGQFPADLPDLPYDIEKFDKVYRVFVTVTGTK